MTCEHRDWRRGAPLWTWFAAIAVVATTVPLCWSGIKGTAHDFSTASWNTDSGQTCEPCHTPHQAKSKLIPLWNHQTTTASFTLYDSETFEGKSTIGPPTGVSKACLSCHDGTVALNSFGVNAGQDKLTGAANLGSDLSNDHPICFVYDAALALQDLGLEDPSIKTVAALNGRTIRDAMLIDNVMHCTTCHDVHAGKGDAAASAAMLVVNNAGSALCLTCHKK